MVRFTLLKRKFRSYSSYNLIESRTSCQHQNSESKTKNGFPVGFCLSEKKIDLDVKYTTLIIELTINVIAEDHFIHQSI